MLNDSLDLKIKAAKSIIIDAYNKTNGKLFISFSGGKDSRILMDIALSIYPNLPIVFSNTTNEMKEVLEYVKTFKDVIVVTPKMSFKKVLEKYGFPLVSKEVSQKVNDLKHSNGLTTINTRFYGDKKGNGQLSVKWRYLAEKEFDVTHLCCKILKKSPLEKWAKEHDLKPMIALMADESRLRQQLALFGNDYNGKVYPFLRTDWEEKDIWEYAKRYNIRFAECYYDRTINGHFIKAKKRTGCEYCGFGITLDTEDKYETTKLLTPKRHESIMQTKNNGITFEEAIAIAKQPEEPILDLYGIKIQSFKTPEKHSSNGVYYNMYNIKNTIKQKICPCCNAKSTDLSIIDRYDLNYFDSPHPITNNTRNVWVTNTEYLCNNCGKKFFGDMHLFDNKLRVTKRLKSYIKDNMDKKNSETLMKETNLSFGRLYQIAKVYL